MKTYRVTAYVNLRDDDNIYAWIDQVTLALSDSVGCTVYLEIEPRDDNRRIVPINCKRTSVKPKISELA
jgi:hypothetical protein